MMFILVGVALILVGTWLKALGKSSSVKQARSVIPTAVKPPLAVAETKDSKVAARWNQLLKLEQQHETQAQQCLDKKDMDNFLRMITKIQFIQKQLRKLKPLALKA